MQDLNRRIRGGIVICRSEIIQMNIKHHAIEMSFTNESENGLYTAAFFVEIHAINSS
jgi:hypothetical protein